VLELRDKVAVVTGAAGGIGSALARALAHEGCRVLAVDLPGPRLRELARELGERAMAHAMDVSDAGAWDDLAARVKHDHGGLDLLVNNAGLTILGAFADQTREDIDRILGVNVGSVLHGCRAFLPLLGERGDAHVVNVSSLAGRVAFPYQSTYSATKFAVRGFSAALRMELAARNVGVTAVLPGAVATKLLETARTYDSRASGKMAQLMLSYGLRPDRLAKRIVRAIRRNEAEVLAGWDAQVTTVAHAVAPSLVSSALSLGFRLRRGGST
jgi:NADP-dependent 3-hydroxy acid dehydrogenase YdfG